MWALLDLAQAHLKDVRVNQPVVLTVDGLSRCSLDLGREPCRGERVGIQAWSTTEMTVDALRVATR